MRMQRTELKNAHSIGESSSGINKQRFGNISNASVLDIITKAVSKTLKKTLDGFLGRLKGHIMAILAPRSARRKSLKLHDGCLSTGY